MAKAQISPDDAALEALARAVADPAPRPLYGTAKSPGIFSGPEKACAAAARVCLERDWIAPTGEFVGKGKSRKELYRITPAGVGHALENSEPVRLLRSMVTSLQTLAGLKDQIASTLGAMQQQAELASRVLNRLQPPDVDGLLKGTVTATKAPASQTDWLATALDYLSDYQRRNAYAFCPLPELYHQVAEPRGLTIGQFHDGLRRLVQQKRVRLHPFTGAQYQLDQEHLALVASQGIQYYAERLAGA